VVVGSRVRATDIGDGAVAESSNVGAQPVGRHAVEQTGRDAGFRGVNSLTQRGQPSLVRKVGNAGLRDPDSSTFTSQG